jgi:hypothetical protein
VAKVVSVTLDGRPTPVVRSFLPGSSKSRTSRVSWFSGTTTHLDVPQGVTGDFLPWDLPLKQNLPSEGEIVSCFIYKSS